MRALRDGVEFVWTHPVILSMMALDSAKTSSAAAEPCSQSTPAISSASDPKDSGCSTQRPQQERSSWGSVMSVRGPVQRPGVWVLVSVSIYGVFTTLFGVSRFFWLSFLMLAGAGAANTVSFVLRNTINQLVTPDDKGDG